MNPGDGNGKGRQQWLLRLALPPSESTGASADGSIWGLEGNQRPSWSGWAASVPLGQAGKRLRVGGSPPLEKGN